MNKVQIDSSLKNIDDMHSSNTKVLSDNIDGLLTEVEKAISSSSAESAEKIIQQKKVDSERVAAVATIVNVYLQGVVGQFGPTKELQKKFKEYQDKYIQDRIGILSVIFQSSSTHPSSIINAISSFYAACERIIGTNADISRIQKFSTSDPKMLVRQVLHIMKTKENVCVRKQSALSKIWWLFLVAILLAGIACLAVYAYNAHIAIVYFATGLGLIGVSFIGLCVYEFLAVRSLYHYNVPAEHYDTFNKKEIRTYNTENIHHTENMRTVSLAPEPYEVLSPKGHATTAC